MFEGFQTSTLVRRIRRWLLAFDAAVKDGRIKKGELVLFEAMGGGFTWGAVLAR